MDAGAEIRTETEVRDIVLLDDGGYAVEPVRGIGREWLPASVRAV